MTRLLNARGFRFRQPRSDGTLSARGWGRKPLARPIEGPLRLTRAEAFRRGFLVILEGADSCLRCWVAGRPSAVAPVPDAADRACGGGHVVVADDAPPVAASPNRIIRNL